jgi:hypothetical protein
MAASALSRKAIARQNGSQSEIELAVNGGKTSFPTALWNQSRAHRYDEGRIWLKREGA